jgi:hypothetical protein
MMGSLVARCEAAIFSASRSTGGYCRALFVESAHHRRSETYQKLMFEAQRAPISRRKEPLDFLFDGIYRTAAA